MILIIFNFKKNYNETLFENFILKNIIYFLKNVLNSFFLNIFFIPKAFSNNANAPRKKQYF